jgi:D-glycero-D-manno-heptose 1,7-bisphosphate phosphatase
MVTNQPDVARGIQKREVVDSINQVLSERLSLDDIKVCYHDDSDNCKCRKPEPGLLLEAAQEWKIDLSGSFVVGDRWKDIEAGCRAGCSTIFVDRGYSEVRPKTFDKLATSLSDAAEWILHKNVCAERGTK